MAHGPLNRFNFVLSAIGGLRVAIKDFCRVVELDLLLVKGRFSPSKSCIFTFIMSSVKDNSFDGDSVNINVKVKEIQKSVVSKPVAIRRVVATTSAFIIIFIVLRLSVGDSVDGAVDLLRGCISVDILISSLHF